ncbi:hypothetical protein Dsin_015495 [Dipteronia sinensis]|uniref:DUF8040 domain-containing protein n=1 Tax=Dipteronia sinensis TaxID=43782 RepID=A0AAE0ABF2_9ROSI|nr:hypothetical protein Dsin_015495 [Dipteronia sinensis]
MDGEENLALTWNEIEMDVEENLELTWDDTQMDEEENLGLSWGKNWEDIQETQDQSFRRFFSDWERQRCMAAVHLVYYLVQFIYILDLHYCSNYVDWKFMNNSVDNQKIRNELMQQVSTNEKCRDIIRMSPSTFAKFCELLRDTSRLKDNKNAIVEEQVAKFLQPNGVEVPQEIITSYRFYPYFKFEEMAKKTKINVEGGQPKKYTVKWTESMDVVLLDALLEQQANGNRIDETFITSAYNNVLKIC